MPLYVYLMHAQTTDSGGTQTLTRSVTNSFAEVFPNTSSSPRSIQVSFSPTIGSGVVTVRGEQAFLRPRFFDIHPSRIASR